MVKRQLALYVLKGQWWWRRLPAVNSEYTSLPSHFAGTILFTGDHFALWLLGSPNYKLSTMSSLLLKSRSIIYMFFFGGGPNQAPQVSCFWWQLVGKSDFASYLPVYYSHLQIMYIFSVTKKSFFFAIRLQMLVWFWSVSMRSKITNVLDLIRVL